MEATRVNTKNLRSMTALIEQKKELEHNLKARHKKMVIYPFIVLLCHHKYF